MMQIVSPSNHAAVALFAADRLLKRQGNKSAVDRINRCFAFRCELGLALAFSKAFLDDSIFEYERNQLKRVAQGSLDNDDLEFDFIIPNAHLKIDVKSTLNEHLLASKRHNDVCYILCRPADVKSKILNSEEIPINVEGWCMGVDLEQAPTWLNAPLYCPKDKLRPIEELLGVHPAIQAVLDYFEKNPVKVSK